MLTCALFSYPAFSYQSQPVFGSFNVAIQLQGADWTTVASSPATYVSLVNGLESRVAAAMKISVSSVSTISIVPGSIVATFEVSITNPSFTADLMYATLVDNSLTAFEASFLQTFGITGMSSQMVPQGSSSMTPFPPSFPQVPPSAGVKAASTISSPPSSGTPASTSPSTSTGTVVIIVATVASVAGAAVIAAAVAIFVLRRRVSSRDSMSSGSILNAGSKSRVFPSSPSSPTGQPQA